MEAFILNRTPLKKLRSSLFQIKTKLCSLSVPENLKYEDIKTIFSEKLSPFDEAVSATFDLSTNALNDQDRDKYLRLMFKTIDVMVDHPDLSISKASKEIRAALRNYSYDTAVKSMLVESSDIRDIKSILSKPENQARLVIVEPLQVYVTALFEAEDRFLEGRISHDDQKAERIVQLNASEIRDSVITYTNEIVLSYVYVMGKLEPTIFGDISSELNEIVKENNVDVRGRNYKEDEEGNERPETPEQRIRLQNDV